MLHPVADVFVFMAIFARIGAMVMMFPVLGEISVSPRVRLAMALAFCIVLMPVVESSYPALPQSPVGLAGLLFVELFVGLLIGSVARLVTSALQVAGNVIAMQTGLSAAQAFDPTQGIQGAIVATFLSVVALTMIVATDLHHVMLAAMHGSYTMFKPGEVPALGDSSALILETIAGSFELGMALAAPFIVFGLVFYLAMGLLAKLMPQVQVFFVVTPASILLGFALLMVLLGTMMTWYLARFQDAILPFAG